MTTLDLNDAEPPREFTLIPAGTICVVQMIVRPGGAGDGWLKKSADGGSEGLDIEYIVCDGEFAKRKVWQRLLLSGTTDGHAKAAEISRSFLRGVLESVHGIKSDDVSPAAYEKRKAEISAFNGMRFVARISVEKSKDPNYEDKNRLEPLPANDKRWMSVEQLPPPSTQGTPGAAVGESAAKPAQAIARPEWAQ
jgi:hypothetical protein